MGASDWIVVLEPGTSLGRRHLAAARRRLRRHRSLSGVVVVRLAPGLTRSQLTPGALLGGELRPVGGVIERRLWQRLGGPDDTLGSESGRDVWLRALLAGEPLDAVLLSRRVPWLPPVAPDAAARDQAAFFAKHADAFSDHAEDVWRAWLRRRTLLVHYKRRYGRLAALGASVLSRVRGVR